VKSAVSRLFLLLLPSCLLSLPPAPCTGQAPAQSSPLALGVLRITSHGCSGTVIVTQDGRSLILTCAHAFQGSDRDRPIRLDGPRQPRARAGLHPARLVKVDAERDLSLIEHDNGPYYCVPVAPAGYRPTSRLLSVGYDEMRWPVTERTATLLQVRGRTTWTREPPWHGRSGGALFDLDGGCLIGVVQAYEVGGQRRGLYVSHAAILEFLGPAAGARAPCPPSG
jgi:hypothetical protein